MNVSDIENISDLEEFVRQKAEELISKLPLVDANKLGLDGRGCHEVYVDENARQIIIPAHRRRTFDYYAGGEYVESEAVTTLGDYVIYSADYSERVDGWLDSYFYSDDNQENDEEE